MPTMNGHSKPYHSDNHLHMNETARQNMLHLFEQFDKDNDGKITKNELNFVMCNLFPEETITEQDINEMLDAADLDRNGFIDFDGNYWLAWVVDMGWGKITWLFTITWAKLALWV